MIPIGLFDKMTMTDMMVLLESDKIKLNILKLLYEREEMTLSGLKTAIHTGHKTIVNNCEFLEKIDFIKMDKKSYGEKGLKMTFIKLTEKGREYKEKIAISNEGMPYG